MHTWWLYKRLGILGWHEVLTRSKLAWYVEHFSPIMISLTHAHVCPRASFMLYLLIFVIIFLHNPLHGCIPFVNKYLNMCPHKVCPLCKNKYAKKVVLSLGALLISCGLNARVLQIRYYMGFGNILVLNKLDTFSVCI